MEDVKMVVYIIILALYVKKNVMDAKKKAVDAFKTKTKTVKISGIEKDEAYFMQACSYIKVGKVKYYSAPGKIVLSRKIN